MSVGRTPPRRRAGVSGAPAGGYRRSPGGDGGRPEWLGGALGWIALALVLLTSGVVAYVLYTLRDLPDPGQSSVLARTIVVLDRKGRQIEQRNSRGQYYEVVKLKDMGRNGPAATLAAEDRNFYHHGAIDYLSTARAAGQDLIHRGYSQGGSTISQQLIKISVLTPQKSIFRKLQEAVLATALEQRYTKDEVLDLYLNRVYYGHNAYGLGAATKVYFGRDKEPRDLNPAQASFLAGLINAPTFYDPRNHFERAKARQLYVLDGMVKTGVLTPAEADQAAAEDIQKELKFDNASRQSLAPHFVDYAIGQLEKQVGPGAVQQGGFSITTTLDLDLQKAAQADVGNGISKLGSEGVNNGTLLAARPDTGEILAWVGSADYYNEKIAGQFDIILSPRQPGSSFKPYVVEAALKDRKATLATTLHDKPTDFGGGYKPLDFDNRFMGDISVRRGLLLSRNVPMVELGQKESMSKVDDLGHAMGIRTQLQTVPSAAIGSSEVTMYEHLQAYQTFANQGTKVPLMAITKIVDSQNNTLFQQEPGKQDGRQNVLSPAEAFLVADVLKDYSKQWDLGWGKPMAGKSGTTGGTATGVHNDAWMMAYNPKVVIAAWEGNTAGDGNTKPISTFGTEVGQNVLAPFINGLPAEFNAFYSKPDGIVEGSGCPGDKTNGGKELFLAGTEKGVACAPPSPSPSPSPSPTPTPAATLPPATAVPSIVPVPTPIPKPSPSLPLPTPTGPRPT